MSLDDARIFHVNVNCSDLERSRLFYENVLAFSPGVRTRPLGAQPGVAFGLDRARWDAWILTGRDGFDGGVVDLLEWQEPVPTGNAPASLCEHGLQRLGISVPDLDAVVRSITGAGGAAWGAPAAHDIDGAGSVRLLMVSDPDGVAIELMEGEGPRLAFVSVCCADLDRSVELYRRIGFREIARFPSVSDDAANLRLNGALKMNEVMLAPPGGGAVNLILVGFEMPASFDAPTRPANAIGMWRIALIVRDVGAASSAVAEAGAAALSQPVEMSMGDDLPDLRFVCHRGPDGEILELIEQPAGAT